MKERDPSKQRFISKIIAAFREFMKTICPRRDKNIKSHFLILVKNEKDGLKQ